ncbi:hypothetical protein TrispH2_010987 [Trichoplax sp. H2]|nr:hypothetical protein TrispH2_010987 [Trichoplax sp. H2]|eukprot:RDD36728.1 hypothetical protein TrispH2_010987 [Trichoplax sp. H2]
MSTTIADSPCDGVMHVENVTDRRNKKKVNATGSSLNYPETNQEMQTNSDNYQQDLKTVLENNRELAVALEFAKNENRKLLDTNLELMRERQDLNFRLANAESKIQSCEHHEDCLQTYFEKMHGFLQEIAGNFSINMELLSKVIEITGEIQSCITSNGDTTISKSTRTTLADAEKSHPVFPFVADKQQLQPIATVLHDGNESHAEKNTGSGRPRRRTAMSIKSYKEPTIKRKLRRGDPYTSGNDPSESDKSSKLS